VGSAHPTRYRHSTLHPLPPNPMNTPNQQPNSPNKDANKIAKRKIEPGAIRQVEQPQIETFQAEEFEQSVVFQQSRTWSRGIVWTILGITSGLIFWACFAPLEEAVTVQGKLEPIDKVKDVQVPLAGVVKEVLVKDGDTVAAGQKLLSLESTVSQSTLASLQKNFESITAETSFYHSLLDQGIDKVQPQALAKINVRPEILALTKSRSALVSENKLYNSELSGQGITALTPEQQQRLRSSVDESDTRKSSSQLEVAQIQRQMSENRVRRQGLVDRLAEFQTNISSIQSEIASGKESLATTLSQIDRQIDQNQAKIGASTKTLSINQNILNGLRPAGAAGAIARTQIDRQEQEVVTRKSELEQQNQELSRLQLEKNRLVSTSKSEAQRQQQRIQEQRQLIGQRQSEIAQLDQEHARQQLSATQGATKLSNSNAINRKELFARIAANDKQIAEIDGQLNKTIVELDRKVADLNGQISQAKMNLKYQDIMAPVSGTIFELKGTPGFVATSSEPVLKIVPNNKLNAKVFISNKDIGFIKSGMTVDVRIDSFPFSEFGDVKGKIISIGSDALPADQTHQYERFPAIIQLEKQNITIKGKPVTLQSGMSLSANVKTRDRTVMSIFTDLVMKQGDSLKTIR
jgi:hemolysin D